jgi:hypothetical protein
VDIERRTVPAAEDHAGGGDAVAHVFSRPVGVAVAVDVVARGVEVDALGVELMMRQISAVRVGDAHACAGDAAGPDLVGADQPGQPVDVVVICGGGRVVR